MRHWKKLLIAAGLAVALSCAPRIEAQQPQPTLYLVGDYATPREGYSGRFRVYWFEQGDVECYVSEKADSRAGNGISCLRKVVP